ncbi:FecR domain-containing protein [Planctomycetota bacterium]
MGELILKSIDDTLSEEEFVVLQEELLHDDDVQDYYYRFLITYIGFSSYEGSAIPFLNVCDLRLDYDQLLQELSEVEKSAPTVEKMVPADGEEAPAPKQPESPVKPSKFWPVTALVSSAALILLLLYAQISAWLLPREVATLTSSIEAKWAVADTVIGLGQRLQTKMPFHLETGFAELVFDEGAKVVVEAPAVFELRNENCIRLQSGRVTTLVSEAAQGFLVDTPSSRVTDLGTEFGVQVSKNEGVVVQMYQGQARLSLKSARKKNVLINKGQARQVNTDGTAITEIPFEKRAFVTPGDFVAMRDRSLVPVLEPGAMTRHPALRVHLDASRVSSVTVGDSATVTAWNDISTGASPHHAMLQKGTATYVSDALGSGLGAIDFGNPELARKDVGTQMRLMSQQDSKIFLDQTEVTASGFLIALVVRAQSPAAENWCNLIGNTSIVDLPGFFVRWHDLEGEPKAVAFLGGQSLRQDCVFIDRTVVLICCYDRASQTLSLWNSNSNETCRVTVPPGDFTVPDDTQLADDLDHDFHLGAFGKSKTRYFDGLVGEVRIYDQALDMNEQMSLKDELVKKWDVTSSDF